MCYDVYVLWNSDFPILKEKGELQRAFFTRVTHKVPAYKKPQTIYVTSLHTNTDTAVLLNTHAFDYHQNCALTISLHME